MKSTKLFLALAVAVLLGACTEKTGKIHCHIEGTVADSTYTMMLLAPSGSDFRVVDADSIPVVDGKFAFDLYVDEVMPYDIISMEEHKSGSWYTCTFFVEGGEVNITFHHMVKDSQAPTLASESPTNKQYLQYLSALEDMTSPLEREADSLRNIGRWYTPRMMELEAQFHTARDEQTRLKLAQETTELRESGEAFTPEYYAFQAKSRRVREEHDKYIEDYMRNDRSVIGLNLLRHQALRSRETSRDLELITLYTEVYQPLFPNHPLSKQIELWIESLGIKVGNRYIDFTAPDLDGTLHTLSKEIGGKIALIDLWASWCGPCRRTSVSMIPIYKAYKDRGFTIVGVAREDKRENMERALAQDGYPWLNLLELRDENGIWSKYGVSNAGGITVLVDRDGTILAIHPTAEEVERILQEKL